VTEIPYARLGIPEQHLKAIEPSAPAKMRMVAAKGLLPVTPEAMIAVCFVLQGDEDESIRQQATDTITAMPIAKLLANISMNSHPKVLEFLVGCRPDEMSLFERVLSIRIANDRTIRLIAIKADTNILELLVRNQERLLIDPELILVMRENSNFSEKQSARVESFLRLHNSLPEIPASSGPEQISLDDEAKLEAEIEAALMGMPSPTTFEPGKGAKLEMFDLDEEDTGGGIGEFEFSYSEDNLDFDWSLMGDASGKPAVEAEEGHVSIEKKIALLTVGQKIKMAYSGNGQVRKVLLRDANKLVATSVVRSGRMNDAEILSAAGNRNLPAEIIGEIARNKESVRRYPVKVALVNNSKTPIPIAVGFINDLHKGDLRMLTTNKNIPSIVNTTAIRMYKKKYNK
tara:strand:+ start:312 stop:1514 length:1203 start_codon:yes stop_codon:yes gene_type:complete